MTEDLFWSTGYLACGFIAAIVCRFTGVYKDSKSHPAPTMPLWFWLGVMILWVPGLCLLLIIGGAYVSMHIIDLLKYEI